MAEAFDFSVFIERNDYLNMVALPKEYYNIKELHKVLINMGCNRLGYGWYDDKLPDLIIEPFDMGIWIHGESLPHALIVQEFAYHSYEKYKDASRFKRWCRYHYNKWLEAFRL